MAGRSRVTAGEEQGNALLTLAHSRDRGEADRARAILLTLSGWTSPRIAEAFGVREDTMRLWRSEFARGGVEALKATVSPGPPPVKTEAALRVVTPLLEAPVADRPNWTISRLMAEIKAREGVKIGKSQLSRALRKKTSGGGGPDTSSKAARLPTRSSAWDCAFSCARPRPKPATSSSSTATRARP